MAKDKPNLSVLPILNKNLKPQKDFRGRDMYPLYARVILGPKNNSIPVSVADYDNLINTYATEEEFVLIEEDFAIMSGKMSLDKKEMSGLAAIVDDISDVIHRLRDFHDDNKLGAFSLTGLSKKLKFLFTPVHVIIEKDIAKKTASWLLTNRKEAPFVIDLTFRSKKPFETNFERILQYDFDPEILQEIEFLFLMKAYMNANNNDGWGIELGYVHDSLLKDSSSKFSDFLDLNSNRLFTDETEMKLPLVNRYCRHVSLFPPSQPKSFYVNKLNIYIKKIYTIYVDSFG